MSESVLLGSKGTEETSGSEGICGGFCWKTLVIDPMVRVQLGGSVIEREGGKEGGI